MSEASRHTEQKRECQLSTKYKEFIKDHIETLKTTCQEFTVCINELLTHQSAFALISGEDINLKTVCGMIQSDENNTYQIEKAKCTSAEKETIKNDIEQHLNDKIRDQQSWNKVKKCLGNSYGDKERSTYVNEICGLARKQDRLCNKRDIHNQVEAFFNDELHHLRCTCDSLNETGDSSSAPVGAIVGGVIGGLLLLVLATLLGIFYCKYKRQKRKKSSPNVIYLPSPNSDNYPVYQEVFDDPYDPRYRPSPPSNPPTLPNRYNPNDESAYLEPMPPGSYRGKTQPPLVKTVNNPGYEKPPEYSEREQSSEYVSPPPEDNGYFEPIPSPPATDPPEEEAEPYDTLLDNEEEENGNSPSRYEPFNSFKSGKLGPDPSQRTKKEDRQTESTYFELEKVTEEDTDTKA